MEILHLFRQHKEDLVAKWVAAVFATYPLDTTGFMRTRNDQFANPVGEMTTTCANYLYDAAAGEHILPERLEDALNRFVRLRSVQDFSPSQGIGVIYIFKDLMRETLLPACVSAGEVPAYLEAESRLDTLGLMAFDMYIRSRETIAEQRIKEIRDKHSQVLRWAQSKQKNMGEQPPCTTYSLER